jgi:hypothetical protein
MFALTDSDLDRRIIDCGGGPASFNVEVTERGGTVVSCDPLYEFSADEIDTRIRETTPAIIEHVTVDRDRYIWTSFDSPEQMIDARLATMRKFLADFSTGLDQGRYRPAALPALPFAEGALDLALCSHLLFTYSDQLSLEDHIASIREMTRVASEARIFPLLHNTGEPSPHLEPLIETLSNEGYSAVEQAVSYEFQRGGNKMLVVTPRA